MGSRKGPGERAPASALPDLHEAKQPLCPTLETLRRPGANSRGQESNLRVKEGRRGALYASLPPPSPYSLSLCLSLSLSHTQTHTQQTRRLPERSGHIIIGKMLVMFFSLPGSFQLF